MQVIGSGFGRTGTLSMKRALEELGFGPCYHMEEVLRSPARVAQWHTYATGGGADWHEVFSGFGSAVDFPASVVYRELMEAFPDAKVVHTVRDSDRWYASTHETIYQARSLTPRWLRWLVPVVGRSSRMIDLLVWDGLFGGRFEDRDRAIEVFEEWTAEVIATVPPERLLVFDVREGWGPLCEFLGVLEPLGPFPRVNDRESMLRRFRGLRVAVRAAPVLGAAVMLGMVGVVRRLLRRHGVANR